MSNHTPIPWHVETGPEGWPEIWNGDDMKVAECVTGSPCGAMPPAEQTANAAIIVRAVNCHQRVIDVLRSIVDARDSAALADDPAYLLIDRAIDDARAALKLAEGGVA